MYTHARQFPHLQGYSDSEITGFARRGMQARPDLIRIMRARNWAILIAMGLAIWVFTALYGFTLGLSLAIAGGAATAVALVWNFVWVNTVMFRITKTEVERMGAGQGATAVAEPDGARQPAIRRELKGK